MLRHKRRPHLIAIECKRANPAVARWCFAKAPSVRRNRTREYCFAERLALQDGTCSSEPIHSQIEIDAYHIALEVRQAGTKGEPHQRGRGAIEEAATQVLRGVNGLAQLFLRHPELLGGSQEVVIIPAIVTTAELFVSPVDLLTGNLRTGKLPNDPLPMEKRTWTSLQYNQSPNLKPSGNEIRQYPPALWQILDREYVRTVPIVNGDGIGEFLSWSGHLADDFGDLVHA